MGKKILGSILVFIGILPIVATIYYLVTVATWELISGLGVFLIMIFLGLIGISILEDR